MPTLKHLHQQASMRRNGFPAFTLLELIVVLLVLGILAAIAVPTFQRVKENSVERVAQTTLEAIDRNGEAIAISDANLSDAQIAELALAEVAVRDGMSIERDGAEITVSNSTGEITATGTVTFSGGIGAITAAEVASGRSTTTSTTVPEPSSLVVSLDAAEYSGSGAWQDLTTSDNDATLGAGSAAPTFNAGGWFNFDGGDYMSLGTIISAGSSYTAEAWVWDTGSGANRNILSTRDDVLFMSGSQLRAGVGANYGAVSSSNFPTNTWKHVVFTFDNTSKAAVLYVDGTAVSSSTQSGRQYSGMTLRIGAHEWAGSPVSFWNGRIAMVRVYNSAITAQDVSDRFSATSSRFSS